MSAQCDNIGAMLCHLDIIGCLCMQIRPCLGLSETFYICMGCVNIQYWGAFVCTSVRCSCQILESEVSGTLWPILHHRRSADPSPISPCFPTSASLMPSFNILPSPSLITHAQNSMPFSLPPILLAACM